MRHQLPKLFLILVAALVVTRTPAMQVQAADAPGSLRAGAATANITPPLGGGIIGGFAPIPATHIHDQLHARCLVLDDGKTKLALVVCDVLGIHNGVSTTAREHIARQVQIPPTHVLISATHTHSANSVLGKTGNRLDAPLDDYQTFVAQRIADGVQCAVNNLRPAELAFLTVDAPEHVFNRRWYLKAGSMPPNPFGTFDTVKMNPGAGNANLLEPAGPVDPTVSVLAVRGQDGRPISVFAAYSLHYVGHVGPGHISADYFGEFCEHLARAIGGPELDPPCVVLLANGTSGDINNINFRSPRPGAPPYAQIRAVAHDVSAKIQAALTDAKYLRELTLDARYREPEIAWRRPDAAQLEWVKTTLAERKHEPGKTDLSLIYAERIQRMTEFPETARIPLQVLRIGDVCIGTMPCEVFCEIGLDFKRQSPFAKSFMVSLNHGYFGYLPTPRQHELGGYETWLGTNRLEKTASDKMQAELLKMAAEMKLEPDGK